MTTSNLMPPSIEQHNKDKVKEHIRTVKEYDQQTILDIKAKLKDLTYGGMMELATQFAKIVGSDDVNKIAEAFSLLSELDID